MANHCLDKSDCGIKGSKCEGNWISDEKKYKKGFWSRKFVEFCERTDLHGYKYIVMNELNVIERACWALFVALSIVCAASFVITSYRWYARNPILTVIETTQAAIWDVPFPAVTICDLNIVSRKAAHAFAHNLMLPVNVTAEYIFEILRLVPVLHSTFFANAEQKKMLFELQTVLNMNNISIETLFRRISPATSCNNILHSCKWKNTPYRCDELFQQVFAILSLCCTFNYFAVDSKVQRKGNNYLHSNTPRRVASCGYQTALAVVINTDFEDYYSAAVASQGVSLFLKPIYSTMEPAQRRSQDAFIFTDMASRFSEQGAVFVDNAYNIPNLNSPVRIVNPSTEMLIALTPESIYSSSGVKNFNPEERQCYYKNEINIGKFRHYSFHNCLTYHLVMMIKHYCQCIPFFIPSKATANSAHAADNFEFNLTCLPECEHYDYPFEVALGMRSETVQINGFPFHNDVSLENCSILNVFFSDLVSTRYRRDVYLNWQNILATFGGLLGLILGFTLISGFDLILFFVLRVIYDGMKTIITKKSKDRKKIHVKDIKKRDVSKNKCVKKY